jgi:energy-coupling factor transporter transmembrane protein EcfT
MQKRFEMMRIAQTLRGYKLNFLTSPIPLLIPMLHFSFKKSKELALSLDCRGFDEGSIQLESELKMRGMDYVSLVLLFILLLLMLAL